MSIKKISPGGHIGIALALCMFGFLILVFFPRLLPNLDTSGALLFLGAFLIGITRLFRIKSRRARWILLVLPVISLIAFLDEISYGAEFLDIQTLHWDRYNIDVYDLHNLIGYLIEIIGSSALFQRKFQIDALRHFLLIDGLILILVFAFVAILRYRSSQKGNSALRCRLVYLFLCLSIIAGTATFAKVLSIPPDPKNAWLFGYSKTRIVTMGGALAVLLVLLFFVIYLGLRSDYRRCALERLDNFMQGKWGKIIRTAASIGIVIGLSYQVVFSFNPFPDYRDFFNRLTPLLAWMLAESILLLLFIQGWRGRLTHPLGFYGRPVANFFSNYPAYVYLLVAIGLMVFAQLLDQAYLVLPPSITALTHNSYGPIEELSEFMASVLLFLSAFLVTAPGEKAEEVAPQ